MGQANYMYDPAGRLLRDQDAAGASIVMSRSDASGSFTVTHTSGQGVVSTFKTSTGADGSFNRLNSAPGGFHSSVAFLPSGAMTTTAAGPHGTVDARFGYDADGLLTCASPTSCSQVGSDALVINRSPTNGRIDSTQLNTVVESRTYNAFGELATITATSGSVTLLAETYDSTSVPRDSLGRVLHKTENVQGVVTDVDYSYDSLGRIKTVGMLPHPISYKYDANGNRLSSANGHDLSPTATYDAQDRLLTYKTFTYAYTANGELQSKTDSSTGQVTSYQYDVFGNLKRVTLPNSDVIQYLVDGENRRIEKIYNGTLVRRWVYRDGLHPVAELDSAGNLLKRFIYGTGSNSPDILIQAGVEYRILSDQLGSPRLVVNWTSPGFVDIPGSMINSRGVTDGKTQATQVYRAIQG